HLDTALLVLRQGEHARIAYYPAAFSTASQEVLEEMFPNAIRASAQDAACLGLNGISDGHTVILPAETTDLARQLANHGYQPWWLDVAELRKAGGGPKRCTLELHTPAPDASTEQGGPGRAR